MWQAKSLSKSKTFHDFSYQEHPRASKIQVTSGLGCPLSVTCLHKLLEWTDTNMSQYLYEVNHESSTIYITIKYLVHGFNPSEKYQSVEMIIPNMWENKIHVPNRQTDIIHPWITHYSPMNHSPIHNSCEVREPPDSRRDSTLWPSKSFWEILLPTLQVQWMDCILEHNHEHHQTSSVEHPENYQFLEERSLPTPIWEG